MRKARKDNVDFFQSETSANASGLESYKILVVKTLRNNTKGEELFVHHGSGYHFIRSEGKTFLISAPYGLLMWRY